MVERNGRKIQFVQLVIISYVVHVEHACMAVRRSGGMQRRQWCRWLYMAAAAAQVGGGGGGGGERGEKVGACSILDCTLGFGT